MRGVDHTEAPATQVDTSVRELSATAENPAAMPTALAPAWTATSGVTPTDHTTAQAPMVIDNVVIVPEQQGLRALDLSTGEERWHYRRDIRLCALSTSDGLVVATFDGPAGCGETVSLRPETGQYFSTRRSLVSKSPAAIRSNTHSGVYSDHFLELWRNDLVRVVEYGDIPATAEPNLQPHPECSIVSALTRVEFLAVLNDCAGTARLVLQDAKPDESREPEVAADIDLGASTPDMRLVAIGQDTAAVAMGDGVRSYRSDGTLLSSTPLPPPAPAASAVISAPTPGKDETALPRVPLTADLPHHMTWFSPAGLIGFNPNELDRAFEFPEATGTPAAWGKHMLMPVADGIAVINGDTLKVIGTLLLPPVSNANGTEAPSASAAGPTALSVVGNTLLVQRGHRISAMTIVG